MKTIRVALLAIATVCAGPALAEDLTLDAAIGGAVGGAVGGAIGAELGGRDGAIVGWFRRSDRRGNQYAWQRRR